MQRQNADNPNFQRRPSSSSKDGARAPRRRAAAPPAARTAARPGPEVHATVSGVFAALRAGRTRFSIDDKTPLPKFFARSNLDPDSSSDDSSDSPSPSSAEPNSKRGFRIEGAPRRVVEDNINGHDAAVRQLFYGERLRTHVRGVPISLKQPSDEVRVRHDERCLTMALERLVLDLAQNSAARRSIARLPSRRSEGSHHSPAASRASQARPLHTWEAASGWRTASASFFSHRWRMLYDPVSETNGIEAADVLDFAAGRVQRQTSQWREAVESNKRRLQGPASSGEAHTTSTFSRQFASSLSPR